jgi:hypothetical protein
LRYETGLMLGGLHFAWRPAGWELSAERHPARAGWCIASYAGAPNLLWWVDAQTSKSWQGISVPLWMLYLPIAALAALAWYLDRALVRTHCQWLLTWLTPKQPNRLGFRVVAIFWVVHVVALFIVVMVFEALYVFFVGYQRDALIFRLVENASVLLFWSAPVWGLLWAWIYVRMLNSLFRRRPGIYCMACGYDLTGNVTGRCPECGVRRENRKENLAESAIQ